MFSIAYVILPFADVAPADAIRASLAPFQRGGPGDIPDDWLTFQDETNAFWHAYETWFTFTDNGRQGLQIEGGGKGLWYVDGAMVQDEMRRRGLQSWHVCFADLMDLDTFFDCFSRGLERDPISGCYGHRRNPLGRWDWWDLGGRFDGYIIGEPSRGAGRGVSQVSSGQNPGRSILSNVEDLLSAALDQTPVPRIDVRSDRNIELAATLLTDIQAGWEHACPGALVLPPGSAGDRLRWLDTWPELGPAEAFAWLGLARDARWPEVVKASYALFQDHWVAGIAYHL
jgi:hypothetical protein